MERWQIFLTAFGVLVAIIALFAPSFLSLREQINTSTAELHSEIFDLQKEIYELRNGLALIWCSRNPEACEEEAP